MRCCGGGASGRGRGNLKGAADAEERDVSDKHDGKDGRVGEGRSEVRRGSHPPLRAAGRAAAPADGLPAAAPTFAAAGARAGRRGGVWERIEEASRIPRRRYSPGREADVGSSFVHNHQGARRAPEREVLREERAARVGVAVPEKCVLRPEAVRAEKQRAEIGRARV